MTAEIAILNRNAVALAADSAVTVQSPDSAKIYNTANKLFMLSKYHPVGVMVFGSADLMAVPWETIVKIYRSQLRTVAFDHLQDYAEHFLDFFHRENLLFPADLQEQFVQEYLSYHMTQLRQQITSDIEERIKMRGPMPESEVQPLVKELVGKYATELAQAGDLPSFGEKAVEEVVGLYRPMIEQIIVEVFEKLPVDKDELIKFCGNLIGKQVFMGGSSGAVIAGFGEKDVFPSLHAYDCQSVMGCRMRYLSTNKVNIGVTGEGMTDASIIPFAQREMVNRFMEGIDPIYRKQIDDYLSKLLREGYPSMILEAIALKLDEAEKTTLAEKLKTLGDDLTQEFKKRFGDFRQNNYVGPIISTVAVLPKDELAAMAESLVNLTSFKRRVTSAEQETVGGPIDVAVISKGDGFIWIKRKHYFEKDLNPTFFANYYRRDEVGRNGS